MKISDAPRPTIRDVATVCGVSEATVSYVINGKRTLRPDTREKVVRVMREMNYHPSAVARSLSSKRVHTLGILFGAVNSIEFATNSYVSGLLQGIMQRAQSEGFDITFFTASWKDAATSAPPLRDGRTAGVLTISPQLNSDMLAGLSSMGIAHVSISAGTASGIANIDVDNYAGAGMAATHLLGLGHRRIAFLMGNEDMASFKPRREGFEKVLQKAGVAMDPRWVLMSHYNGSHAYEQARELLSEASPPTAFFAANDNIALRVLEAAQSLGIDVPGQLSVVGFDDIPAAKFSAPQLTTIRQPLQQIGDAATKLLIDRIQEPQSSKPITLLHQPELIVRGTTAPPAQS